VAWMDARGATIIIIIIIITIITIITIIIIIIIIIITNHNTDSALRTRVLHIRRVTRSARGVIWVSVL
jgi:hypothetical protein